MGTQMGLMRVFWPSDAPLNTSPGILVGFQNSATDLFVVAILHGVEVCEPLAGYYTSCG